VKLHNSLAMFRPFPRAAKHLSLLQITPAGNSPSAGEFFRANMADEADKADKAGEVISQMELAFRKHVPRALVKTGWCWNNCGARADGYYCSPECREDHETRKRLEARGRR
jgi:hypothetical protein